MAASNPTMLAPGPGRYDSFPGGPMGATLCVAISALSYFLAIRFIDLWPLALLAPMPVLAAAFAAPSRTKAALCAFVAFFIGGFGEWASENFFLSIPVFVLVTALSALLVTALILAARVAARRWNSGVVAALAFPILYAALNFILSLTLYDGTWGNPAYRQTTFLPLLQIASVTGLSGIVFAMTLPASGIALAWYRFEIGKPWRAAAGVPIAIFGAVLLFGAARLLIPAHTATVRVAMIASDRELRISRSTDPSKTAELLSFYVSQVPAAAAKGAQIVVLPEKIVGVTPSDREALVKILSSAASSSHVWLVAGVNEIGRKPLFNAAWIFSPDGALIGEYDKHYFVRGFEAGYQSGAGISVIDNRWGKTGVAICKDLDYPGFIRRYGERDVTLMLVPAWDWVGPNATEHERMALARGVENGFSIARSAKQGFVTAHDAFGRTLASDSTFADNPAMALADIPVGPGTTLYSRFGDWFGWLCVALSILLLAMIFAPAGITRQPIRSIE